jgi:hypothetical protein
MPNAAEISPRLNGEDTYRRALQALLRTSAEYFDLDAQAVGAADVCPSHAPSARGQLR